MLFYIASFTTSLPSRRVYHSYTLVNALTHLSEVDLGMILRVPWNRPFKIGLSGTKNVLCEKTKYVVQNMLSFSFCEAGTTFYRILYIILVPSAYSEL